mmetsp:Transcript_17281/g.37289  ORF Transcript_17281/g.37289 Transcript_17281/m.37289 type:complete len:81 (+) Transcript_17281:275-517(+)
MCNICIQDTYTQHMHSMAAKMLSLHMQHMHSSILTSQVAYRGVLHVVACGALPPCTPAGHIPMHMMVLELKHPPRAHWGM